MAFTPVPLVTGAAVGAGAGVAARAIPQHPSAPGLYALGVYGLGLFGATKGWSPNVTTGMRCASAALIGQRIVPAIKAKSASTVLTAQSYVAPWPQTMDPTNEPAPPPLVNGKVPVSLHRQAYNAPVITAPSRQQPTMAGAMAPRRQTVESASLAG